MFIYVIVCSENLKLYVGQHKGKDLQHYLQQKLYEARNRLKARSHLYAAMRKHPRAMWSIHPLVLGVEDRKELDALEQHFIRVLKTQHPDVGYNICRGGEGFTGPHTAETLRKIDEKRAAYWKTPEAHERVRRQTKERWTDPAYRQETLEQLRANTWTWAGKKHSAEHNRKIGLSGQGHHRNLGRKQSPEEIEKRRLACLGKQKSIPHSKEHNKRVGIAMKKLWQDPAFREKVLAAQAEVRRMREQP